MIEAVSKIGDYVQRINGGEDLLSTFIENPNSNGKYKFVLIVVLNEVNGEYSFSHVEHQEFKDFENYLYKRGYSAATDATPTSRITELDKTFKNKFLKWFQNCDNYDVSGEDKEELKRMSIAINDHSEKILMELSEKISLKKADENAIITLGIEINDEIRYLKDIPVFRNVLLRKGKDRYISKKSQGISLGKNALCSICKERKEEVYGFAIPWTFHTFDKPGFIAGGFEISESWKNTPVCFECATCLELGKKYIEKNLDFGFYKFRYLLVPKLASGGDIEKVLDIMGYTEEERQIKINKKIRNRISSDEKEILGLFEEEKDFFSNSLIFYKKEQSSYRILLLIEGILPSRLRAIFKAKEKVDERFKIYNDGIFSEAQREKIHLEFNFGVLRRFFPRESKNRTFDKIFLEIVNKIFVGERIDYNLLMNFLIRRVRAAFVEGNPTNIISLNGFLLLHYLNELNLFAKAEMEMKNMHGMGSEVLRERDLEGLPLEQRVEKFFEANKTFFDSNAKRATFLEGVLAQKLLNIQWKNRKATPFRTKLHGLKMNERLIKRLLPDIQNKLEEYDRNYYRQLEEVIANHFVSSGINWREGDDELSFYFVLGMDMHKMFKNSTEDEQEIEGEAKE